MNTRHDPRRATLPRRPPPGRRSLEHDEADFAALRAAGLQSLRELAGEAWTDHNLHDPGITLLELVCHAITDLCYRNDLPMADLLCEADGQINLAALCLTPPGQALASPPTTLAELRTALLSRVDDVRDIDLRLGPSQEAAPAAAPDGLLRAALQTGRIDAPVRRPAETLRSLRRAWSDVRGLGTDLANAVALIQPLPLQLQLDLSADGRREPVALLAEVCLLLRERIERPDIATGLAGNLDPATLADAVRGIDGVVAVTRLDLLDPQGRALAQTLTWDPQQAAPSLAWPATPDDIAPLLALQVHHAGLAMSWSASRLAQALCLRPEHPQARGAKTPAGRPILARPHDLAELPSLLDDLPPLYGTGRHGLPSGATVERRAQAEQLRGYVALLERPLAQHLAQLADLRHVFSASTGRRTSRPGMDTHSVTDSVTDSDPARDIDPDLDPSLDHDGPPDAARLAMLDHLLWLHGVALDDEPPPGSRSHLSHDEQVRDQIERRARWLRQVEPLARDRGLGQDLTRHPWQHPDATCALQQRLGLRLGFGLPHTRALLADLQASGWRLVPGCRPPSADLAASLALTLSRRPPTPRAQAALSRIWPEGDLDPDLLARAADHRAYRWRPTSVRDEQGAGTLLLAADEVDALDAAKSAWPLATLRRRDDAVELATALRQLALRLDRQADGLHLIEHVLLRPVGDSPWHDEVLARHGEDSRFHVLRLSIVLAGWTLTGRLAGQRAQARRTIAREIPAHLRGHAVWLDPVAMATLERHLDDWWHVRLAFQKQHAGLPDLASAPATARNRLNRASAQLIDDLLRAAQTA